MLLVIDIDGTIADGTARFAAAGPEPSRDDVEKYKEWVRKVNTGIEKDKPVPGMQSLLRAVSNGAAWADVTPVYLTGREEALRNPTEIWLNKHKFPSFKLFMRPQGSWASNAELKEFAIRLLASANKYQEVVVIDDDEKGAIEEMCKRHGWTFQKARSGGQK